ncbi:MAG: endonuclease-3, partial [Planctomycetota bacterium]
GVARKTANVVLGECYGIADGVVVDTHVKRLTNLLGMTKAQDPKHIEKDLMVLLPKKRWIKFAHQLILHGRRTCIARRPQCDQCYLLKHCPGAQPKT